LLIGQELCKALFNDEYQYVLAVHVDHSHVHNHVIVNNVNFYTGKTFETEHNQGKIPDRAWNKLRTISDELCRKHGLSIIENPHLSNGKSHWEWELDKQNLSWKEQLKRAIDEVIKVSEDLEDFLAKCTDFGILVDYNPDHKINLKFMLAEQKAYRELQLPNVAPPDSENYPHHSREFSAVSGLDELGDSPQRGEMSRSDRGDGRSLGGQGEYEGGKQGT